MFYQSWKRKWAMENFEKKIDFYSMNKILKNN